MNLDEIASVNWPTGDELRYRVVQLYLTEGESSKPVLVYEEEGDKGHEGILKRFLDSIDIKFEKIKRKDQKIPALKGDGYEVCGMGFSVVSKTESGGRASFFGSSMVYDEMGLNTDHLKLISQSESDWEFKY